MVDLFNKLMKKQEEPKKDEEPTEKKDEAPTPPPTEISDDLKAELAPPPLPTPEPDTPPPTESDEVLSQYQAMVLNALEVIATQLDDIKKNTEYTARFVGAIYNEGKQK